ncbi:hypothetical protein Tco_0527234 [Tanacetum coccineum]
MSKNDMSTRISNLTKSDLGDLVKTYHIPLDHQPRLPDPNLTMDHLHDDAICIYTQFLYFFGLFFCDLGITPTVTLFWGFQSFCKQGDWFSFAKRRNMEDACMDKGPSSMKKWKNKFFLIDRKAIPDYLTWRNFHSYVSDDLPTDGYDRNEVAQLCTHLTRLHEINEAVLNNTTAPAAEGTPIPLLTLNEVAAAQPNPKLAKKSKVLVKRNVAAPLVGPSEPDQPRRKIRLRKRALEAGSSTPVVERAEDVEGSDISDFCTQLEDSLEMDNFSFLCIALSRYQEYDDSPEDDFAAASLGKEIDLTLFPLASSPYVMPYPFFDGEGSSSLEYTRQAWDGPYAPEDNILCKEIFKDPDVCRKVFYQTITPAELKRTESLLSLQLSNQISVLTALLASHGIEMNSRYTTLVAFKARLREKRKRKENRELRSLSDTSSEEFKNLKVQLAEAKATTARSSDELARTDAKLSDQALVVGNLKNELGLERSRSQGYRDVVLPRIALMTLGVSITSVVERGLSMRHTDVEFEEAAQKIVEEAEGALSEVVNIQPDKIVCLTLFPPAPTTSYPAGESFGWTFTPKGSEATDLALDFLPP